ncbi:MAG: cell division protein FtsA [Candidatus Azobacteroides sp.]|nr:cell division protein FtsA [Candidatus Azobacteroides sp.]
MEYVVAIDLGTSKVVGMMARKEMNQFTVLALEEEIISSLVKRGSVHNVGDLAPVINRIIKKLENKTGKTIVSVYVNLNGQSLRAEEHIITYSMKNEDTITQELLDKLKQEVFKTHIESEDILDVVDPEYYINNTVEYSPVGIPCSQIECRYKLIIGKPSFKRNVDRCFERINQVSVADYIVSPLATSTAVLSKKDKELGCALIEFGAGVTTLSVYKNNLLRYLVTIPFGGENITKDICKLNVLEKYAEKLKVEIGNCFPGEEEKGKKITLKSEDHSFDAPEIEVKKLNEYIFARENEIVVNVFNQLKLSGYSEQLAAGIIVAGGASRMKGLFRLLESQTNLPVKQADILIPVDVTQKMKQTGYEQVLGMLWLAEKNCIKQYVQQPPVQEQYVQPEPSKVSAPKIKKNKINPFRKIGDQIGSLFGDDSSDDLD